MEIKGLEAEVNSRFNIADSDLEAAANSVKIYHAKAKQHGWGNKSLPRPERTITISRDGIVQTTLYSNEQIDAQKYIARVEYEPHVEFTRMLVDQEINHLQHLTDLPFRSNSTKIIPDGFNLFTNPWQYSEGKRYLKRGQDAPGPNCRVGIEIMGFLDNKQLIRQLKGMVDDLYLPVVAGEHYWNTDMGYGSTGGSHPTIVTSKRFDGLIGPEAEEGISELYNTILSFVLRNEVTTGFKFEEGKKTWADLIREHDGYDMRDYIASSTAARNAFYGPHLRIEAVIPFGEVRPELRYKGDGKYTRQNTQNLSFLTTFADTIFPPERPSK